MSLLSVPCFLRSVYLCERYRCLNIPNCSERKLKRQNPCFSRLLDDTFSNLFPSCHSQQKWTLPWPQNLQHQPPPRGGIWIPSFFRWSFDNSIAWSEERTCLPYNVGSVEVVKICQRFSWNRDQSRLARLQGYLPKMLTLRECLCTFLAMFITTATDELLCSWPRESALPPPLSQCALPALDAFRCIGK